MRFLTDQDVYGGTVRLLLERGHDVLTAHRAGLSQASDSELLRAARDQARILVTRDRDFGALTFVEEMRTGIIYLRIHPSSLQAVHAELESILSRYPENELLRAFVVVEPGRHRIRHLE